jgi:monoamine oxidase
MKHIVKTASALLAFAATTRGSPMRSNSASSVLFHGPFDVARDSVHNIHIGFAQDFDEGPIRIFHGSCDVVDLSTMHHEVGSAFVKRNARPDRWVWVVPNDAIHLGCLHAFDGAGSVLLGRSAPVSINEPLRKRQNLAEVADTSGPWFDGVAAMESKSVSGVNAAEAKNKSIAIVGGGMAGLLTSHLLESVGINNWHIIESSERIGGRIRTKYLAGSSPDEYQYQEMGPMRFPVSVEYADTNETLDIQDHKMVFQLGEVLNELNGNDPELEVKFIPWIQSSPNVPANSRGYRMPNGLIPSRAQLAADGNLTGPAPEISTMDEVETASEALEEFVDITPERMRNVSQNVFKAHKEAIEMGLFHWSEADYLRYELGLDANTVDYASGAGLSPMWGSWYDTVYFAATTWRTIDKGLESLPRAFFPLVEDRLTLNRRIEGLTYHNETDTVSVEWRDDPFSVEPSSEEYDYAVVAVPFSKVRLWKTPQYSSLLTRAIQTMNYQQSCKVALHYKTRFWEHQDPPIIGGCGSVDIYGIGSVCYPAYEVNSSWPGVILASYASGTPARSVASMSDEEHVGLVYRAMIEVHGQVAADEYTGNYDRQCWETDAHQAGAWAAPYLGQQELYLPSYYETEYKTIFIGEHTSYTHAWIFSALDSAVRGTAQLLLDMGLVDEAKEVVEEWMGRWISI